MANQPYAAQKSAKKPRLFLKKLFTLGWENRDVLWPSTVQTADGKTKPFTPKYPDNMSGAYKAYRGESKTLLKASLYFLIFLLPILALLLYVKNLMLDMALGGSYNFMGGIGIGYPGIVDSISGAMAAKYGVFKIFYLYLYAGVVVASIGLAGLGNVARKVIWNEPIKKYVAKPFFDGIKKHAWKYLIVTMLGGGALLGIAEALLFHLTNSTLGTAGALSWIVVIGAFVLGIPVVLWMFSALTILPSYKLSFGKTLLNSLVLLFNKPVSIIFVAVFSLVPLALTFMSSIFAVFIVIIMIAFGCSLFAMIWTGLGHSSYLRCAVLYEYIEEHEKKQELIINREKQHEMKRENRNNNKKTNNKGQQAFVNPKKKKKK